MKALCANLGSISAACFDLRPCSRRTRFARRRSPGMPRAWRILLLAYVVVIAITCAAQDNSISFLRLGSNLIQQKANLSPATVQERAAVMRNLFSSAGCAGRVIE